MAVNKITAPPTKDEVVDKINEVIDNLGGGGGAPVLDDITVSKNSDNELQAIGVIDDNSGNAIKTWTGTKAQYDAIVTKDATTLYNIVDDTDTTFTLLELLFPVGAVYFGTMATCPLQTLGIGTWQLIGTSIISDVDINSTAPVIGNGMTLGLTDGTNNIGLGQSGYSGVDYNRLYGNTSHYGVNISSTGYTSTGGNTQGLYGVTSDPTKSGIIADTSSLLNATKITINIFKRIS